ncbi:MAG: FecR domain-containing protein [Parabacteroides sp.]|nr:FecR domain-containing protein [Parabacteroides sp.]
MTEHEHIDFLHDKDFITWRLTGDPSLEADWKAFLAQHPAQQDAFEKAIRQFSRIRLNPERLTETEEKRLLRRIHATINKTGRRTYLLRFIGYAAAACLLLASGLFLYRQYGTAPAAPPVTTGNLLAGEELDKEDIYLITDSKATAFTQDVQVQIDEKGAAIVQEAGKDTPTVIETGKAVMNKLVVPYGKRSRLILSDGSKVWVNSGSVLEFPSSFTGNSRRVSLTGEMFIDVAKDRNKPFYVHTPGFQVKVYGTQFNISAYPDDRAQSVVLVSGKVGVKSAANAETYLQPNEMVLCSPDAMQKKQVDVTKYVSWKDGYIVMEQMPVTDVLKLLGRYYDFRFEIEEEEALASLTCDGKLYLSDNPDNVMQSVSALSSVRYRRDGKTVYIRMNP